MYIHIIIYAFSVNVINFQDYVLIGGKKVDSIKLQSAKLTTDASKCALQLTSCLFTTKELANGNPNGISKSKDQDRKNTIKNWIL